MNNYSNDTLENWAGANRLNLALVFTDIVDSTAIGQKLGDNKWMIELSEHFRVGRLFACSYDCFVVKVIGDAFMVAFRNNTDAVEFSLDFSKNTGVEFIGIRVGIHTGQVQIMDNDIYGLNVNKTARIQSSIDKEGICVSDPIKEDFIKAYGSSSSLRFIPSHVEIKNFRNSRIWKAKSLELIKSYKKTIKSRNEILGIVEKKPINTQSNFNTQTTTNNSNSIFPRLSFESSSKSESSKENTNLFAEVLKELKFPSKK